MYIQLYNHIQPHTCPLKYEGCSRVFTAYFVLTEHIQTHEKSCSKQNCGTQFTDLCKLSKQEKEYCICENSYAYDLPT